MTPTRSIQNGNGIFLPGYDAQLSTSGVSHSISKIEKASTELLRACAAAFLQGHHSDDNDDDHSLLAIEKMPCNGESESRDYRCSCSFQILREDEDDDGSLLLYAMRQNARAEPLNASYFPIALPRIQRAMSQLLHLLNSRHSRVSPDDEKPAFQFPFLRGDVAAASFVCSWDETDCFCTLHYSSDLDVASWRAEAEILWEEMRYESGCSLTSFIGRSKGKKCQVGKDDEDEMTAAPVIRDTVTVVFGSFSTKSVMVSYRKPIDAFQHPNGVVMRKALKWILQCLMQVSKRARDQQAGSGINLLEMYCGCGAHTVAISKASLFHRIVAVENDRRLVDACRVNCDLNRCGSSSSTTPVTVVQDDAANVARRLMRRSGNHNCPRSDNSPREKEEWWNDEYHVLLVDPPRQGLDESVRRLAMLEGRFQFVLYVSCGRDALKRDLDILKDHFVVESCAVLDLFPRTSAVESLVCLQRRED